MPARRVIDACKPFGVLPGVEVAGERFGGSDDPKDLLIAVTEKRTRAEMEQLLDALKGAAK